MQKSLVSIGLPTYKCESRIKRVLGALLGQDYLNIEIIVSDDASGDKGPDIIEEYARKDERIKFFRKLKNIGYLRNFEFVLKEAKGEYFFWAADDDDWEKNFISTLKNILDSDLGCGLAMPSMTQVFPDGEVYKRIIFDGTKNLTNLDFIGVFMAALNKKPPVEFLYYGLWRTEALKKLVFNQKFDGFLDTIAHDKILMYEASLSVRPYTIQQVLWHKTTYKQVYYERYSTDSKKMFLDTKGYWKFVIGAIKRLTFSPNIPVRRKLFLPYFFLLIFWVEKKNLFRELFPRFFWFLRKVFGKNK